LLNKYSLTNFWNLNINISKLIRLLIDNHLYLIINNYPSDEVKSESGTRLLLAN